MYKIIAADGTIIGYTEAPMYIHKARNGCYAPCKRENATGVAYGGAPYHLFGTEALDELADALVVEMDSGDTTASVNTLLGNAGGQAAEQFRRAVQMYAVTLTEEQALEIPSVYPAWEMNKAYAVGDIISYGVNSAGDPQLYKVVQAHTSAAGWTPDATPALYDAFGLDEQGYPVWSQPTGAHDAYNTGDIVNYNGTLYISLIDGNTWSPDAYPAGWQIYEED